MAMVAEFSTDERRCLVCDAVTLGADLCPLHYEAAKEFNHHLRGVSKFENISVATLSVDRSYQRSVNETVVKDIIQHFNEFDLGYLTVSRRPRENVLVDGQHRWAALLRMGYADAPCEVLEKLTLEQEIMIFVVRNQKRRAIRRGLLFNDQAAAGIEPYRTASEILRNFNYELIDTGSRASVATDKLSCPATVETVHRMGKLAGVLFAIRTAWPESPEPNRAEVLLGIAAFLQVNPHVQAGDLGEALARFRPERLVEQAKSVAKSAIERRLWVHFYEQVVQAYNYNRRHRISRVEISPKAPRMWFLDA